MAVRRTGKAKRTRQQQCTGPDGYVATLLYPSYGLSSGEGQLALGAPALKNSAVARGSAGGLMTTVLFGRGTMPAFGKSINDADVALILSCVRNTWGNQQGDLIDAADVAAVRAAGK